MLCTKSVFANQIKHVVLNSFKHFSAPKMDPLVLDPRKRVFMCFGEQNPNFCHIYDGGKFPGKFTPGNFETSVRSNCDHYGTDGLAIYRGLPFTTGSNIAGCYNTTEIFDIEEDQWNFSPDYPFHS